ncbi:Tetrathionate response regulatory protein TtrR [Posidoniimonas corsicana]|uniref:Tetrathionate response regulatory protein TtrR n=1 Tax=Posidoniimonas corsicana TaxID=1938618 RepID=A0A5C5V6H4_9BACT|nr:helix-turn-helix transcriptional regulator [Posidoniimonas corsicana]TWT33851.1 Tetrathionate response regulatory protein TtrR [Posidoniimonas corsicana]
MPKLTPREEKMMRLIVDGASNVTLAKKLGIALRTAELHRAAVMKKLGASSPAQLGYKYAMLELKRAPVEAPAI